MSGPTGSDALGKAETMEIGPGVDKLAFVFFCIRNGVENGETLELHELQGLSEILDGILLELATAARRK